MLRRYSVLPLLAAVVPPTQAMTEFDPSDPKSCKIIGDPDIYGTGIRISFYLQWASLLLAIWLAPETTKNIRTSTNIVSLALFINVFRSVHSNSLIFLEFYLVSWMTIFLLLANIPWNKGLVRNSIADTTAMLVLWFVFMCTEVYMYSKGFLIGQREGCVVWTWGGSGRGSWNNIYEHATLQLMGTISVALSLAVILPYMVVMVCLFGTGVTSPSPRDHSLWSTVIKSILTVANVILGPISIVTIEKTIHHNKIDLSAAPLLQSSGQLIALVMGILSLITVLWACFMPFEEPEKSSSKPCPPSQQHSSPTSHQDDILDPELGQISLRVLDSTTPSRDPDRPILIHPKTA